MKRLKESIVYDLRKAVEKKEFTVYYQPQIDMITEKVISLEALVRWLTPSYGMVPPSVFIPVAEETGLISHIGEWVLRTACRQVKEINDKLQLNMTVSVNLSPIQLQDRNLLDKVFNVLEDVEFSPNLLEIEITEDTAIKDVNTTIRILKELGNRGIKIALDDFCTGYSSLCYLEYLAVDKIKIDKSFIQGMNKSYKKEAIIESLISLAHRLGIFIVAEGVEEQTQFDFLKARGCDIVQGYYFSRPLPFADLERYMRGKAVKIYV